MTDMQETGDPAAHLTVNAGRLWAGGLATAAVAALIAVAGVLVGRGVFGIDVLAPKGAGVWGDARTGWYAFGAALAALVATGLIHFLLMTTPRPMRFFAWVIGLATVVAMLAPWVAGEDLGDRMYTAGLNLVLGVAIGSLVAGTARTAIVWPAPEPGLRPSSDPYR